MYAADVLPPALIHQLQAQERHVILVVDECDARHHETLAGQLPAGSPIKLITIGEPTGFRPRAAPVTVGPLDSDALHRAVRENQHALWPEHARFVVDASGGNVRLVLLLADAIVEQPSARASDLITRDIIGSYVTQALPAGREFLACCALALFAYVGYQEEPSAELTTLAAAFDLTVTDLRASARHLTEAGLLSEQGRYRSVSPHPLAIYLATRGWDEFHDRIVTRLLPAINMFMAERLFQRAADIGELELTKAAVTQLLAPGGLYENADAWGGGSEGMIILHFAALAPGALCGHIETLLAAMSDAELSRHSPGWRTVTWALERLAWRTTLFRRAADMLLRFAVLSPGIDYDSDAVRSWTDLFGTMLPTTAASPAVRADYLLQVAACADRRRHLLAAVAAGRALAGHEVAIASSETQGGVLLERRGRPTTSQEAFIYWEAAIKVLDMLARDDDSEVANLAISRLIGAIQPSLRSDRMRSFLSSVVAELPEAGLTAARTEITRLDALIQRAGGTAGNDIELDRRALGAFAARLPVPTPEQTLESLANTRRWDLADGELQQRLTTAAAALPGHDRVLRLLGLLDRKPGAAYEIGRTLGELVPDDYDARERLLRLAAPGDQGALVGYLYALVEGGTGDAFDQVLDSAAGVPGDLACLQVSVRGPQSHAGWARVSGLIARLNPKDGARALLGWHTSLAAKRLQNFLADWLPRINTWDGYNAVVGFVGLALHGRPEWIDSVDPLVADLVALRSHFAPPTRTGQQWEWEQLARRQLKVQPAELLMMLLDLVEAGDYRFHPGPEGNRLLRDAVVASGDEGWREMMTRLAGGSWQIRVAAGRWLGGAADVDTVRAWIEGRVERARLVASAAAPGGEHIDPVAQFLISAFGSDDQVSGSLRDALILASYWGPEATQYQRLIDRVTAWQPANGESSEVLRWIELTLEWLKTMRDAAARREAEPGL